MSVAARSGVIWELSAVIAIGATDIGANFGHPEPKGLAPARVHGDADLRFRF
jgi:hypothetical protein